ncbi:MAG: hypothetical protein R3B90_13665 [Planctomycetaceae bacterium]
MRIKSRRLTETLRSTWDVKQAYWRSEMSLSDRGRMWAEQAVRAFPQRVTGQILAWMIRSTSSVKADRR